MKRCQLRELQQVMDENSRLNKLVVELALDKVVFKEFCQKRLSDR
jgi:hypothetical protein